MSSSRKGSTGALPSGSRKMVAGSQMAIGAVTSCTVTLAEQVEVLPLTSVTVRETGLLPILEQSKTSGFDEVYASHTFHKVTMYYPMRVVHERRYKLIWNINYEQEYPFASVDGITDKKV